MKSNIPNILVACRNTPELIGIKQLLTEVATAVSITAVKSIKDLMTKTRDNHYQYIFIHEDFYKQKRTEIFQACQRCSAPWFVLGHEGSDEENLIDIGAEEEQLAQAFRNIFQQQTSDHEINGALSDREKEILKYVAKGMTNKEISEKLFISMHTVITHRKNITSKLEIKTIPGLTIYAILNNIIDANEVNF